MQLDIIFFPDAFIVFLAEEKLDSCLWFLHKTVQLGNTMVFHGMFCL